MLKEDKRNILEILEQQYIFPLFDNEELNEQYHVVFDEISKSHPIMDRFECMKLFLLGFIWGKRIERSKRK